MVIKPEFGDKVIVSKLAVKHHLGTKTLWNKEERYDLPKEGLYIGKRCVYDGKMVASTQRYEDVFESDYFSRGEMHEIWLVVFNERENPVRVFPEDVSW